MSLRIEYQENTAKITINGVPVKGVRKYTITHEAGGRPMVNLEISSFDIFIDGVQYVPLLPEYMKDFYEPIKNFPEPPEGFLEALNNAVRTGQENRKNT